jgi:tetratricopeptide (TPR) repeat protein
MDTNLIKQQLREGNVAAPSYETVGVYRHILATTESDKFAPVIQELRLQTFSQLGQLEQRLGNATHALEAFEQYYQEAITPDQQAEALNLIGDQMNYRGEAQKALQFHQQALRLAEEHQLVRGKARALGGIGYAMQILGKMDEARAYLRQSLNLFWQLNDIAQQRLVWSIIGISHSYTGEIDKALEAYQESLRLSRKTDNYEAIILNNIGECYQLLFDMEQAKTYHERALAVFLPHEPYVETDLHRNLGVDLCELGEIETGLMHLHKALEMSQHLNNLDMVLQTLYSLSHVEIEQGNYGVAREYILKLQTQAEGADSRHHMARACFLLGVHYQKMGETAVAEQQWQQALLLAHETGQHYIIWQIHAHLAQICPTPDLAKVHYRIATEVIDRLSLRIEDMGLRQKFLNAPPIQTIYQAIL